LFHSQFSQKYFQNQSTRFSSKIYSQTIPNFSKNKKERKNQIFTRVYNLQKKITKTLGFKEMNFEKTFINNGFES
jgi:hypothetical protein